MRPGHVYVRVRPKTWKAKTQRDPPSPDRCSDTASFVLMRLSESTRPSLQAIPCTACPYPTAGVPGGSAQPVMYARLTAALCEVIMPSCVSVASEDFC